MNQPGPPYLPQTADQTGHEQRVLKVNTDRDASPQYTQVLPQTAAYQDTKTDATLANENIRQGTLLLDNQQAKTIPQTTLNTVNNLRNLEYSTELYAKPPTNEPVKPLVALHTDSGAPEPIQKQSIIAPNQINLSSFLEPPKEVRFRPKLAKPQIKKINPTTRNQQYAALNYIPPTTTVRVYKSPITEPTATIQPQPQIIEREQPKPITQLSIGSIPGDKSPRYNQLQTTLAPIQTTLYQQQVTNAHTTIAQNPAILGRTNPQTNHKRVEIPRQVTQRYHPSKPSLSPHNYRVELQKPINVSPGPAYTTRRPQILQYGRKIINTNQNIPATIAQPNPIVQGGHAVSSRHPRQVQAVAQRDVEASITKPVTVNSDPSNSEKSMRNLSRYPIVKVHNIAPNKAVPPKTNNIRRGYYTEQPVIHISSPIPLKYRTRKPLIKERATLYKGIITKSQGRDEYVSFLPGKLDLKEKRPPASSTAFILTDKVVPATPKSGETKPSIQATTSSQARGRQIKKVPALTSAVRNPLNKPRPALVTLRPPAPTAAPPRVAEVRSAEQPRSQTGVHTLSHASVGAAISNGDSTASPRY